MTKRKGVKPHSSVSAATDDRAVHLSGLYLLGYIVIAAIGLGAAHPQVPVQVYSVDRVTAALELQNFSLHELRRAAEKGSAKAQVALAARYFTGEGAAKNELEAYKWIRRAAAQGDALGEIGLGAWYFNGEGVEPADYAEALKWFSKAAAQGNVWGQMAMGVWYVERHPGDAGKGRTPDSREAFKWFSKAADQGNPLAEETLGAMYIGDPSNAQHDAEAFKWYSKAAAQGDIAAQEYIGQMYANGKGVARNYTEAFKWYSRAANAGNVLAQNYLGSAFENGKGVRQDFAEARRWYHRAALAPWNAEAQCQLGWLYQNGKGGARDYAAAARWYGKAAARGNAAAQYLLGDLYQSGKGVVKDAAQAAKWHEQAVPFGLSDVNETSLISWVTQAVSEVMTFGYNDYQKRLQDRSHYFTSYGWEVFTNTLVKSGILDSVVKSRQAITTEPRSAPVIIQRGVSGDKYWVVRVPLKSTYESATGKYIKNSDVTLVIERVPVLENIYSARITQWYQGDAKLFNEFPGHR